MVVRRALRWAGGHIQIRVRVLGLELDLAGGIPDHQPGHHRTEAVVTVSESQVLAPEGIHGFAGEMAGEVCYNPLRLEGGPGVDGCIDPAEENRSHLEAEEDH